ncbi:hypothetical protein [Brevundimonas sp. M20]|uniref:hypothetical protein n=1 Tax=Brevundimonas sp. M20 TaxID=2591463 RepID=UPI0011465B52|nr:hypothetical protein [Brevundimonas sp. M20]QDH73881.1 hypothetical protein FKQ52_10865 [Brevundimonas sp. M20]
MNSLGAGIVFWISIVGLVIGVALWAWSFIEKHPIRRLRQMDCGTVLVFSSILLRFLGQGKPMSVVDWALALLAPLFVCAALWRLTRTACPAKGPMKHNKGGMA